MLYTNCKGDSMAKETYHKYIIPLFSVAVGAAVAWGTMHTTIQYTVADVKRIEQTNDDAHEKAMISNEKARAQLEIMLRRELARIEAIALPREVFDVYTQVLEQRFTKIEESLLRIENIYKDYSYEKGS